MIVIAPADLAAIAARAEAGYPAEACGLLVGHGRRVVRVDHLVAASNLLAGRARDRFELDPRVRIATERRLRGGRLRIVGHWHSHPDGIAWPSAIDLAHAFEPRMIWLVAAVSAQADGRPRTERIRAFRLDRDRGDIRPVRLRRAVERKV